MLQLKQLRFQAMLVVVTSQDGTVTENIGCLYFRREYSLCGTSKEASEGYSAGYNYNFN
jgi:hypothetical protein